MKMTKEELIALKTELRAEFEALKKERQQIIFESSEAKLERNRMATITHQNRQFEYNRAEAAYKAGIPLPPRYAVVIEAIKTLMAREQSINDLLRGGGVNGSLSHVPKELIREDAVAFANGQRDEAEKEIAKLQSTFSNHPNVIRDPRAETRAAELRKLIDGFPKTLKLAECGSKLFGIKREMRELCDERDAIMAERNAALDVA
jgi:hypothetical protein